jgi:alkylation response protein AidB-like acyl-CoA dehydrogenase
MELRSCPAEEGRVVELEITSEQEFFVDTTEKYLSVRTPVSELRALRDDPVGFHRDYWLQGAELGWTSLLVSEENGGGSISKSPLGDLALLAFVFGRHAAPGPLVSSNVVAGALSSGGTSAQRTDVLPGLLSGEALGSWCYGEPSPHDGLGDVTVSATLSGDTVSISGVKRPVEGGGNADVFLVTATTSGAAGLTQVLVNADTPGVTVKPMKGVDLTRRFATVGFDGVEVPASALVGEAGMADRAVDRQLRVAVALELAEMTGAMDKALEMTIEWAFDRYSFGRPLASYQELKHRFADMKLWLEASHAISDAAVRAVEDDAPNAWDLLSAGKAYVGHYGVELVQDCVQLHGGIGVTFDHDLHLYLRRVVLGSALYGTVAEHRRRLTDHLEQRAS